MWNRRRIWVVSVLGALVLCLGSYLQRSREPYYNGRPLSYWVLLYGRAPYIPDEERQALASLRLDTHAIPYLLEWIQYTPDQSRFTAALHKAPEWLNKMLGNPIDLEDSRLKSVRANGAESALAALGPKAITALPKLERFLITPPNEWTRLRSAYVLAHLGELGQPILAAALTNDNPRVRWEAVVFLNDSGTNASPAVPLLLKLLTNSNSDIRDFAAEALQGFAPEMFTNAVPEK